MLVFEGEKGRDELAKISLPSVEKVHRFEMKGKYFEMHTAAKDNFATIVKNEIQNVHISPIFLNEDGREQFASDEILVELNNKQDFALIKSLEKEFNLERVDNEGTRWLGDLIKFKLLPPYSKNSIEISNAMYESGKVVSTCVNWVFDIEFHNVPTNDLYYGEQWNIPKTMTQHAWNISTGTSNIVIAVIDEGVDLNHEDLSANLYRDGNGNIIGINTTDNGASNNPHPYGNDAHGTASAGIAASRGNNSSGVAGAA